MLSSNSALLVVWTVFSVLALAGIVAVLVWAVRARQFSNQDRARYLPLTSGIPKQPSGGGHEAKPQDGKCSHA